MMHQNPLSGSVFSGLSLSSLSGPQHEAAGKLLHPQFHQHLSKLSEEKKLAAEIQGLSDLAKRRLLQQVEMLEAVQNSAGKQRAELLKSLGSSIDSGADELAKKLAEKIATALEADEDGTALFAAWDELTFGRDTLLGQPDADSTQAALKDAPPALVHRRRVLGASGHRRVEHERYDMLSGVPIVDSLCE